MTDKIKLALLMASEAEWAREKTTCREEYDEGPCGRPGVYQDFTGDYYCEECAHTFMEDSARYVAQLWIELLRAQETLKARGLPLPGLCIDAVKFNDSPEAFERVIWEVPDDLQKRIRLAVATQEISHKDAPQEVAEQLQKKASMIFAVTFRNGTNVTEESNAPSEVSGC